MLHTDVIIVYELEKFKLSPILSNWLLSIRIYPTPELTDDLLAKKAYATELSRGGFDDALMIGPHIEIASNRELIIESEGSWEKPIKELNVSNIFRNSESWILIVED